MAPLRKKISRYLRRDDELLDSGPVTLRSARFEAATPVAPSVVVESGVRSADEISGVMPVARRLMPDEPGVSSEAWSVDSEGFLFDDDVSFVDDVEPDTVRMPPLHAAHSDEPPPPTLRSIER